MGNERLLDKEDDFVGFKYNFLHKLHEISNDEIMELAMDSDNVMGLLEISLYPSESSLEQLKYSRLATELLCTNVFLDVIISGYIFGMDFDIDTNSDSANGSDLDSDLDTDSDLDMDSEKCSELESELGLRPDLHIEINSLPDINIQCNNGTYSISKKGFSQKDISYRRGCLEDNRLDRIYAMPICVLIAFILDNSNEYETELGFKSNIVGTSNFSKLVYSLMMYDFEWTWKYVLLARNGKVLLNLSRLVHNPSVFHLLKLIIGILFDHDHNHDHDHKLLIKGTETKIESILASLYQNLVLDEDLEGKGKKRKDGAQLVISTCEFLVDIFQGFLDLAQVFEHFSFEHIQVELTPLSLDTNLSRKIKYFKEKEDLNISFNYWSKRYRREKVLLSDEIIHELIFNLGRSIQELDFILKSESLFNLEDLNFYSGFASGLMFLVNTVLKADRIEYKEENDKDEESKKNKENKNKQEREKKSLFGTKALKWINEIGTKIWNFSDKVKNSESQGVLLNSIKLIKGIEQRVPDRKPRLSMVNFEMIKIMNNYIWEIVMKLCMREDFSEPGRISSVTKGYLVSLVVEILDYIENLINSEDLDLLRSLIKETEKEGWCEKGKGNQSGISSIVWEILDVIVFRGKVSNSVLEEKVLKIFKSCLDHFGKDKTPTLGCKDNFSNSNTFCLDQITCTRKYFVLGYLKSSWFLSYMGKYKSRESWMDDRILRRTITKVGVTDPNLFKMVKTTRTANIENICDSNIKLGISRIMRNRGRRSFSKTENVSDMNHQGVSEYLYNEVKSMQEDLPWVAHYLWQEK
ncbi:uncharacterized protein cubi_00737 [Cryptosporidium ubiquitum]|uniref:Uncharacterized protein n=1 Tax=Cryptosporidium ubiquitum TaxID=857276 RepID=A0A1J4MCH1_9CRYT|nr:uncharacterized protein cubi_00737 [Cryptosporidium ubiquitum]OII71929.1 hypothetical protein cubi_00737 [Cryptosporidium ubiquitum]